jgi:UDP-N-acetylmuramyl pentapeptide phosphotransferase/UDP-N-acetylglucosamine-1-phosphate transferase
MLTLLFFGLGMFVLSYIGVALIRRWALHRNLLDVPNVRSSHIMPTPRGGGLAITAIVLIGFGISRLWAGDLALSSFAGYMLGALAVAAISGVDDLFGVSAPARLLVHLFAAAIFVALAGFVSRLYLPFIGIWDLGLLGVPLTLFWIVGLTNAYNFMDGIDGIAAEQAIVAGSLWIVIAVALGASALATLGVLIVGASLGFLLHNTPPARIFMGDVGSTFLGYTFAVLPILAFRQTDNSRLFIAGVLCVAPFVFDTSLTMLRRAINRENILLPHRSHLYQRLVKLGYHHGPVGLLYTALAILASVMGLAYLWGSDLVGGLALLAIVLLLIITGVGVTWLEHRRVVRGAAQRA